VLEYTNLSPLSVKIGAVPEIIGSAIVGLYAWGYFGLLRNLADNLMLWLLAFLVGSALPLVLRLVLIGSGAKAA